MSLNLRPLLLVLPVSLVAVTLESGTCNAAVGTCLCLSWVSSSSFSLWRGAVQLQALLAHLRASELMVMIFSPLACHSIGHSPGLM